LSNKCPAYIILFIYLTTCISDMFKSTDILRQNFYERYFEVRGLRGGYDTAALCFDSSIREFMIVLLRNKRKLSRLSRKF
jgi:hypothetical protein